MSGDESLRDLLAKREDPPMTGIEEHYAKLSREARKDGAGRTGFDKRWLARRDAFIVAAHARGESQTSIANRFGLSQAMVAKIITRKDLTSA